MDQITYISIVVVIYAPNKKKNSTKTTSDDMETGKKNKIAVINEILKIFSLFLFWCNRSDQNQIKLVMIFFLDRYCRLLLLSMTIMMIQKKKIKINSIRHLISPINQTTLINHSIVITR